MPSSARAVSALAVPAVLWGAGLTGCRETPQPAPAAVEAAPVRPAVAAVPLPSAQPQLSSYEKPCLGTRCTLNVFHHDVALVERAVDAAMAEIQRLDGLMSTWVESSDVSRINQAAGNGAWVEVAPETFEVLDRSLWIARLSGGAFDITVGAFKGLWKFDEDNDGTLPKRADVLSRLERVGYEGLVLDPERRAARLRRQGQSINLGGIAKGLIVDRAVAQLKQAGLRDFLVQSGGDLYAAGRRGDRDWRVGIQDPRAKAELNRTTDTSFAMLSLHDSAFNTSGDYERFVIKDGKRYHHILDPKTGYPVTHTRSVTVLAPTAFLADTLDTAVFVLGVERGLELIAGQPGVEAVIVDAKNRVHMSPGLRGRLQLLRPPTDAL